MVLWQPEIWLMWLSTLWIGLIEAGRYDDVDLNHISYYRGRILTVTTILLEPYAMLALRNDSGKVGPNGLYEGYIVDLLHQLSLLVNFRYRLVPVWDGEYGVWKNRKWDGMVGEVVRREADIAAGPLYITKRRRFAVDFTDPFMTVEASLLVRKPNGNGGTIQVASAADLLSQPDVHFGTLDRGFIHHALRSANDSLVSELWTRMMAPDTYAFTASNREGIERVRSENFVFILPNKIAAYVARRPPCDLMAVDNFLVETGFGLALGKGSALTARLNQALDLLARNGVLARLYEKWWIVKGQCHGPDHQGFTASSGRRTLVNVGGRTTAFVLSLLAAMFAKSQT